MEKAVQMLEQGGLAASRVSDYSGEGSFWYGKTYVVQCYCFVWKSGSVYVSQVLSPHCPFPVYVPVSLYVFVSP